MSKPIAIVRVKESEDYTENQIAELTYGIHEKLQEDYITFVVWDKNYTDKFNVELRSSDKIEQIKLNELKDIVLSNVKSLDKK